MKILSGMIDILLEENVDFTLEDVEENVNGDFYFKPVFKNKFMEQNNFISIARQYPMYFSEKNQKNFCQITCMMK